jgi:hypothetical protein
MNVYCDHVIAINSRAAFEIPSVSALLANAGLHREPAFGRLRPPLAELLMAFALAFVVSKALGWRMFFA